MKFSQPHYHFCLASGLAAVGDRVYEPEIYRLRGDLILKQNTADKFANAYSDYQHAEALAEKQGSAMWQLNALHAMHDIAQNDQQEQYVTQRISQASKTTPERSSNSNRTSERTEPVSVLFADVFGYSVLMEKAELEVCTITNHCINLFIKTSKNFGGKVREIAGDGLMIQFTTADKALEFAVAVRRKLAEENTTLSIGARRHSWTYDQRRCKN